MKTMRTSLAKHKTKFLFLFILFVFGLITGLLFYFKQEEGLKLEIVTSLNGLFQNNVFTMKNIFYHFVILLLSSLLLFCFLAIPFLACYVFFEGLSIGFIVPIFLSLFKVKAIGCFFLYFVVVKLFYLLFLFLLFVKSFSFTRSYLTCLKNKSYLFLSHFKYFLFLFILFFLNDLLVYFGGNRILIFLLG